MYKLKKTAAKKTKHKAAETLVEKQTAAC